MARDKTYDMGCTCDKKLLWCDGSCIEDDPTIWDDDPVIQKDLDDNSKNEIEQLNRFDTNARNVNIKGSIVILIIASICYYCC